MKHNYTKKNGKKIFEKNRQANMSKIEVLSNSKKNNKL